ncbi:MAG: sugar phosphate isomerase/epimerase [Christensenellaceae bacterium]|jgi:sugar phosphate isomerase/epimerase|nr:sugar phosphate isomerase/epimerase [Christensenellaceae bacterium]
MIRLGVCATMDDSSTLAEIGYDYLELNMAQVGTLSEEDFQALLKRAKSAPIPVYAMNLLLPGARFPLCDQAALDQEALLAYLRTAFSRAGKLGVKAVSFGSGAARAMPEGMAKEEGHRLLCGFLRLAAPIASQNGVCIAIEPLPPRESNILNGRAEALALLEAAAAPGVSVLADLFHMMHSADPIEGIQAGPLAHTHIAERERRLFPRAGDSSMAQYEAFFAALKARGYEGGVSLEGRAGDFAADAKAAFALLDQLRR